MLRLGLSFVEMWTLTMEPSWLGKEVRSCWVVAWKKRRDLEVYHIRRHGEGPETTEQLQILVD